MTRRSITSTLVAATAVALVMLVAPKSVVACSCVPTQPMAVYAAEPETTIFTGVTEPPDGRGYPVSVTRWFKGDVLAPRVWMAASNFDGNSASCGLDPLPVGGEWFFVAYRIPEDTELIVNLCAPHARLSDPTGRAMLADAMATFGGAQTPRPTLPPTGPAEVIEGDGVQQVLLAIAATTAAALAMILGVYLVTSRLRRNRDIEGP